MSGMNFSLQLLTSVNNSVNPLSMVIDENVLENRTICFVLNTVHVNNINPFASEAVYTRTFFLTACRTACKHATRGCDKRWMTNEFTLLWIFA